MTDRGGQAPDTLANAARRPDWIKRLRPVNIVVDAGPTLAFEGVKRWVPSAPASQGSHS